MPPSTGTFRVLVHTVAAQVNSWENALPPAGECDADDAIPVDDLTISTYLNANGGAAGSSIRPLQNVSTRCPPGAATSCPTGPGVSGGNYGLHFWPATDEIIFNPGGGQEVIDLLSADFPAGFLGTALQLHFLGSLRILTAATLNVEFLYTNVTIDTLVAPNINNTTYETPATAIVGANLWKGTIDSIPAFGIEMELSSDAFQISCLPLAPLDVVAFLGTVAIRQYYFQGEYMLWSISLAISPSTVIARLAPETIFTLTDGDGKLEQLEELNAYTRDEDGVIQGPTLLTILTQTPGQITFQMPEIDSEQIMIYGTGNGAEFTGQVQLGIITQVSGTGIYRLVTDKRNDTYYDRSVNPATTIDTAIPEPFGRTGFVK